MGRLRVPVRQDFGDEHPHTAGDIGGLLKVRNEWVDVP